MKHLLAVDSRKDIPVQYQNTPIGLLFEYHNLKRPNDDYSSPQLLIAMCMDNRKRLSIPDNFAFIVRTGAANLRYSEFKVSYAVSIGGVRHIVLIGHDQCGMVDLMSRKEQFIQGLVEGAGWTRQDADEHFTRFAPIFEIDDEVKFVAGEAKRLKLRYPKIEIAPVMYNIKDNLLYFLKSEVI